MNRPTDSSILASAPGSDGMMATALQEIDVASSSRKFRAYPARRHSHVWGVPTIPDHWQEKPLKSVIAINTDKLSEATDPDYEIEYVDIGNVSLEAGITSTERYRFENAPSRARRRVRHGDTIVSTVRTYLKAVAHVANPPENLIVSTGFAVLRAQTSLDPGFLYRLAQSEPLVERIMAHSVGVSYPAINASEIGRFAIPLPSLDEQRAIAAFLDRETARIDELIAKKAMMIERIDEKWMAYLTRMVARGMDTNIRLRPTGHSWCEFIPDSWELLPLRRFIVRIEQGWSPQADQRIADGDEWAVLKVGAVLRGRFRAEEHKALPSELEPQTRYLVKEGDLLLTRGNTPELVADACIVPPTRPRLLLSDLHYRLALDESKLSKRFACFWLLSRVGRCQIEADAHGTSNSMVKVSQQHIRAWFVSVPPRDEQESICNALDDAKQRLDAVVDRTNQAIQRLKEHRSALITAAVTGQIDVRNHRREAPCP